MANCFPRAGISLLRNLPADETQTHGPIFKRLADEAYSYLEMTSRAWQSRGSAPIVNRQITPGREAQMKRIAAMALMLNVGVGIIYAHERPVRMTFSGTAGASAINLQQPNSMTGEDNFAGNGTLGQFTFRDVTAQSISPTPPPTCSGPNQLAGVRLAGAAVLRFEDGSLVKLTLTEGADCIDLTTQRADCILTFQVTGGTGRFKGASGTLTLTETAVPVLADAMNNPVFFIGTGAIRGTISGDSNREGHEDDHQ
jgi:hypothetical protein